MKGVNRTRATLKWCDNSCEQSASYVSWDRITKNSVASPCHRICLHNASTHLKSNRTRVGHACMVPPHVKRSVHALSVFSTAPKFMTQITWQNSQQERTLMKPFLFWGYVWATVQHKDGNEQESESCLCIQMSMLTPGDLVVFTTNLPSLSCWHVEKKSDRLCFTKLTRTVASERPFDCKHALCQVKH